MGVDSLRPLPKMKAGSQQVIVLTDQYTRLARVILVTAVALPSATTVFVDNWLI